MNFKTFFSSFFYSLVLYCLSTTINLQANFSFGGADFEMPAGGLMQMPSEEEIAEIEKFLSTLSEEDLNQLAKLGEEIIKTAEKEGVPLFAPAPETNTQKERMSETTRDQKNTSESPLTNKPSSNENKILEENTATKITLSSLIEIIEEIRKKSSQDLLLNDTIISLDKDLNMLLFYLYIIQNKGLIRYLELDEFKITKEKLINLHRDLDTNNQRFSVPEKDLIFNPLQKTNSNTRNNLKNAHKLLKTIVERFEKTFKQESILTDLEKIIKKYEPDALKLKEQIKASEKGAFDYLSKIPVTNTTTPNKSGGGSSYTTPLNTKPGSNNFVTPGATTSKKEEKNNSLTNKTKEKEAPKKPTDKQNPKQPNGAPKRTTSDYETAIKDYFDKTENFISNSYNKLSQFVSGYTPNINQDIVQEDFDNINHYLKKLRAYTKRWEDMIFSQADNAEEKKQQKAAIANIFKDEKQHEKLKALHQKTKEFADKKISLKGPLQTFKQYMDSIEQLIIN